MKYEMSEVNMNSNSTQTQVFIMIIVKDMLTELQRHNN